MSHASFLDAFNNYSVEEFVEFLKQNGLSEFETLAIRKRIDGHTFLNLAEFEIKNWKYLINSYQAQKFWSFLNQLRTSPMNFVFVAPTRPAVPTKPKVDKDKLEKLSCDSHFLVALRAAVKKRSGDQGVRKEKSKSPENRNSNAGKDEEAPPPPPSRPNYKKPIPAVPQYQDSESDNSEDPELLYELPDDQLEVPSGPVVQKQPREMLPLPKIQKPLPELPVVLPAKEVEEEVPIRRTPFKLQQHYTKQREKERELEKTGQNSSKVPIQSSPLPALPTPSRGALPKPEKTSAKPPRNVPELEPPLEPKVQESPLSSKRFNSIPRPPKSFPKIKVEEPSPTLPETPKTIPLEQEDFYRYTDKIGADMLLSENCGDGTYLIRPSRKYHGALSVREGDKVYHIGIKKERDKFTMESMGENLLFENLREIVNHFKINPLTVRNKYNQLIDIYLRRTLPADRT